MPEMIVVTTETVFESSELTLVCELEWTDFYTGECEDCTVIEKSSATRVH